MKKYDLNRDQIKNGDLVLFRGKSQLSRQIQMYDDAYYNHVGLVIESNGRLLVIDSNARGVNPELLSVRIDEYIDFCIIRPQAWTDTQITAAVSSALERAEKHIKYDFFLLLQIALYRKSGIRINLNTKNRDICSEFGRRYIQYFTNPKSTCFERPNLPTEFITPWDFIVYADKNFEILFDDSDHSKFRKI
jgi:hypothetical protein